jgi:hypothetical protein
VAKKTIWTPDAYRALFQLMTDQFGPHPTWAQVNAPGNGRNDEFRQFCSTFAELYGMASGKAVEHLVLWAIGPKDGAIWTMDAGRVRRMMAAMIHANEAGFIPTSYFPTAASVQGNRPAKAGEPVTSNVVPLAA